MEEFHKTKLKQTLLLTLNSCFVELDDRQEKEVEDLLEKLDYDLDHLTTLTELLTLVRQEGYNAGAENQKRYIFDQL